MPENCHECDSCEKLENKVERITKSIYPVVNNAKKMMEQYPKDKAKIEKDIENIKTSQTKEDMTLEAIHKRMDKHDEQEETKRQERRDDRIIYNSNENDLRKERRNNLIGLFGIFLSILGSTISFGIWLSNITHNTDKRLTVMERALGVLK